MVSSLMFSSFLGHQHLLWSSQTAPHPKSSAHPLLGAARQRPLESPIGGRAQRLPSLWGALGLSLNPGSSPSTLLTFRDRIIFCRKTCPVHCGCLAASLAFTHWTPAAPAPCSPVKAAKAPLDSTVPWGVTTPRPSARRADLPSSGGPGLHPPQSGTASPASNGNSG